MNLRKSIFLLAVLCVLAAFSIGNAQTTTRSSLSSEELEKLAVKKVLPTFSDEDLAVSFGGTGLWVEITVNDAGKVTAARAVAGCSLFREAAVKAAQAWEFKSRGKGFAGFLKFDDPVKPQAEISGTASSPIWRKYTDPGSPITLCWMARSYLQGPDRDSAVAERLLRRATEIAPGYAVAWFNLGQVLASKQPLLAISMYEKAIALRPDFFEAYLGAGEACRLAGNKDRGVAFIEAGIATNPQDNDFIQQGTDNIQRIYGWTDKSQASSRNLERHMLACYELCRFDPDPILKSGVGMEAISVGDDYFDRKQYEGAVRMYRIAIEVSPNTSNEFEAQLRLGETYLRMDRTPEARKVFDSLLSRLDDKVRWKKLGMNRVERGNLHYTYGCIYLAKGDFKQAEGNLRRAVELVPEAIDVHRELLRLYLKTGRPEAADDERKIIKDLKERLGEQ